MSSPHLPPRPSDAGVARDGTLGERRSRFWPAWCCAPRRAALILSYISIALTVLSAIAGVIIAIFTRSAATLGFALESGVDVISSALIVWRFCSCGANEKALDLREKRASVLIGLTFEIMAVILIVVAVIHLSMHSDPMNSDVLLAFAIPSTFIFALLGVLKLVVACEIKSFALRKDGVCSLAAALLSSGVIFSIILFDATEGAVWWFDSAFAIVIALAVAIYGLRTLIKNKWWQQAFWCPGRELEADVTSASASVDAAFGGDDDGGYDFGKVVVEDGAGGGDDLDDEEHGGGGGGVSEILAGAGGDSV